MSEGFNASQREHEIYELRQRVEKAEWVLKSSGFRRCDIPACNCNSWHHVGGYAERFREIQEAVEEAGYSTNGKTLLDVIKEILAPAIQPQRMPADYAAWLVEINDTTDGPEYFHLSDDDDWIKDHDKALHFARQADADRVIEYYGWTRAKAVEHMWPSHTRPNGA